MGGNIPKGGNITIIHNIGFCSTSELLNWSHVRKTEKALWHCCHVIILYYSMWVGSNKHAWKRQNYMATEFNCGSGNKLSSIFGRYLIILRNWKALRDFSGKKSKWNGETFFTLKNFRRFLNKKYESRHLLRMLLKIWRYYNIICHEERALNENWLNL